MDSRDTGECNLDLPMLLIYIISPGICNVLSVVGEKSGAGSREFRVVLL